MNFYPHHIGDFNNDTRHLTRIERSIYRDLIELYYDTECPLIPDKDKLSRLVLAISQDELTAVEQVLNEFFDYTDNGYFHSRCHETICDYKKNIKGKSKAGIASAKARKARKLKALSELTDVEQVLDTCTTDVRNHKPETINHKPIIKTKEKIVIPDGININSWNEWSSYRKSKKKAISQIAATKQFKMLAKYSIDQQKEIIDKSITGDYQGLFDLNEAKGSIDETIPYDLIAIAYNNHFADSVGVSQVADMSDSRKSMIAKIWNHKPDQKEKPTSSVNFFERYFAHCSTRPNLNGENDFFGESGLSKLVNWNTYIDILEKK